MLKVDTFTFNAFQENMYILSDSISKDCIIFDPGCSNTGEEATLIKFLDEKKLNPVRLINTHCHIDHILGNKLIAKKYGLQLEAHEAEVSVLAMGTQVGQRYGIPYKGSPDIEVFLDEKDTIILGDTTLQIFLTPGHSPGSLCFYNADEKYVIGGDVLFFGSIGRTDLPGGNHDALITSIKMKLLPMPDDVTVYPGHGPATTIGQERASNPFLN